MSESVFQQPDPEQLEGFVSGDPIAIEEVIRLVLPQLYDWGKRHYSNLDVDDVHGIINEVIGEACEHHERYDASRSLFTTYIITMVSKRMATFQRKHIRMVRHEESADQLSAKNLEPAYNEEETDIIRRIDRDAFYREARQQLTAVEADFLRLLLSGEFHQEAFLESLKASGGIASSREVKNTKERLKYKLQTLAQSRGLRLEDLL